MMTSIFAAWEWSDCVIEETLNWVCFLLLLLLVKNISLDQDVKSTSVCLSVYIRVYMTIYISNIILEAVLLFRVCVCGSQILHPTCSAYISWNNGRILMFKVSKWPYWSSRHDEIICRWRHNPPGGENLN